MHEPDKASCAVFCGASPSHCTLTLIYVCSHLLVHSTICYYRLIKNTQNIYAWYEQLFALDVALLNWAALITAHAEYISIESSLFIISQGLDFILITKV